jgi:hypothetical protein
LEELMNDPRLSRLAELWKRSLETALAPAEETELKSLLNDAALAEAWMEAQAARETAAQVPAGRVPASLRMAFQRQFKPGLYWGLRLALPALAALLFLAWPSAKGPQVMDATVDETPFAQEPIRPEHRVKKRDLGPPPGLGDQHLWVSRTQKALQFEVQVARPARLQARILDASGRTVKILELGKHGAGTAQVAWDGQASDGQRAPAGRYRARVYLDGVLDTEKSLVVEKK